MSKGVERHTQTLHHQLHIELALRKKSWERKREREGGREGRGERGEAGLGMQG